MPDQADVTNSDVAGKAKAYLLANCAGFHRPPGVGRSSMDFRYETTLAIMGICNTEPHPDLMLADTPTALLLTPENPDLSIISLRMNRRGQNSGQMPILGTNLIDNNGVTLINEWINSLTTGYPTLKIV